MIFLKAILITLSASTIAQESPKVLILPGGACVFSERTL